LSDWTIFLDRVRWQDALDVCILTAFAFRAFQILRGTVALQVLAGMGALLLAAIAASRAELVLTAYVLQALGAVAVLASVVIFQGEIRRALRRVDPTQWWPRRGRGGSVSDGAPHRELANALIKLAERRIGALVVLPRQDPLEEHLTGGIRVDARLSTELFESIFHVHAPIHDGAVVMDQDRVARAGVFLPISTSTSIPDHCGTRHRAALGLCELSDAQVLIVSEERGEISLASGGELTLAPGDPERLADFITKTVRAPHAEAVSRMATMRDGTQRRPSGHRLQSALALLLIFFTVAGAWYAVAGERSTIISVKRPIELREAPPGSQIQLIDPSRGEVTVTVRGPRHLLYSQAQSEVLLWVDTGNARRGRNRLRIQSSAPTGLEVVSTVPSHALVRMLADPGNEK
jgi:uncharacterized protein (TIGR00159 family)